jgi:hypothetical protein
LSVSDSVEVSVAGSPFDVPAFEANVDCDVDEGRNPQGGVDCSVVEDIITGDPLSSHGF